MKFYHALLRTFWSTEQVHGEKSSQGKANSKGTSLGNVVLAQGKLPKTYKHLYSDEQSYTSLHYHRIYYNFNESVHC
jgi:hypothetical protein